MGLFGLFTFFFFFFFDDGGDDDDDDDDDDADDADVLQLEAFLLADDTTKACVG